MMKKYKKELIISSLCTLIPVFIGLILWNKLPDTLPSHFGLSGEADSYSSKAFAVFVPSLIMFTANLLCFAATMLDKRNKEQNPKVIKLILVIMPILSILINCSIYFSAYSLEFDLKAIIFVLLGIIFLALGNYMPKVKQNYSIGIKVKWTLTNEENWNKTHRFAGKLWVISGILCLFGILLPEKFIVYVLFGSVFLGIFPVFYSWLYYKKQLKEGSVDKKAKLELDRFSKNSNKIGISITAIVIVIVAVLLFTGSIEYTFSDSSFEIKATYWNDLTVSYEKIDSIEYRETFDIGSRTSGYGSPKLSMGQFKNKEFSYYTLYAYTNCKSAVILTSGNIRLVINDVDAESTKELYETLVLKTGKE